MIHLFAGGRSSLKLLNEPLDGLKVVINFGYEFCEKFDILIYLDEIVGNALKKKYTEKPNFRIVTCKAHSKMIPEWVDDYINSNYGCFTIVSAIIWLRYKYPDEKIIIYGLDGDGEDYYDEVTLKARNAAQHEDLKIRIHKINQCYKQLDDIPCGRANIYNGNPNSPYKGFEFEHRS